MIGVMVGGVTEVAGIKSFRTKSLELLVFNIRLCDQFLDEKAKLKIKVYDLPDQVVDTRRIPVNILYRTQIA